MSSKDKNASGSTCCVCYKNAEYYSIGMCEHAVCFECSTRMRVLCQQNECPICRQDLPKVVFTKEIKPFRFLRKGNLMDAKYNIYFDNHDVQQKFHNLLAHRCNVCHEGQVFNSFHALKEHMRRKHDLHYCDLCVENIKIFPHERRSYTKSELSRHRRKGDPDDTSHRGHPLCEFCDTRYMDNDELYRHLRRDHLFCHFCDADGLHHYYCSYGDLRDHFRQEHFLCEEGSCQDEQFTSVFRTDIDLKAHKATVHGRQLGKHAAKQNRTLELEFTLAPRGDLRNRRGPLGQNRNYNNHDGNANNPRNFPEEVEPPREEQPTFVRQPLVDVQSTEEFPSLGNAAPSMVPHVSQSKGRNNFTIRSTLRKGNYDDNFPALGPESSLASSSAPTTTKTLNFSVSANKKPSASGSGRPQSGTPNLSIHVNHRPNGTVMTRLTGPNLRIQPSTSREMDFPALGHGEPVAAASPQSWTKITCVKPAEMPRSKKVAPPPLAPSPPPIRSGQDFPSLSKSKANSHSQILTPSWVQVQSTNTSSGAVMDATKGKAKKKKIKPPQHTGAGDSTSGNESSYSLKASMESKKTKAESSKNDAKAKKNSDSGIGSNAGDDSSEKRSFIPATPASAMRKRSELKIDNLNTTNNNLSLETKTAKTPKPEDFPALGRRPPGLSSPPPGFTAPVMAAANTSHPPPGFLNKSNGLTFTNSSGESYTIVPDEVDQQPQQKQQQRSYSYLPPPNFQYRNKNLIAEFNDWFKSDVNEELKAFKYLSGLYRTGVCDADEYYKQCQTVMGTEVFQRVFPELLALLPDIRKQRELFEVHKRETKSSGRVRGLESCANCGQILRSADLQQHASSHTLENHFPTLGSSGSGSSAWSKK